MFITFSKSSRGFSMVELLVVMAMLALVLTATYSMYMVQSRSSRVQDDVVEVQQNLRIGMDQMTRDLRMAGFLACPAPPAPTEYAITAVAPDNSGLKNSDVITMAMASGSGRFARIRNHVIASAGNVTFDVETSEDVDKFANEKSARIVSVGVKGITESGAALPFTIVSTDRAARTITLSGLIAGTEYFASDLIIDAKAGWPSSIQYCLGSKSYAACQVPACPDGDQCLVRIENGNAAVIASHIIDLQFRYLLADNSEVDMPVDLTKVRAVRVTLSGDTLKDEVLMGGASKQRQIASIVDMRNATKPCP